MRVNEENSSRINGVVRITESESFSLMRNCRGKVFEGTVFIVAKIASSMYPGRRRAKLDMKCETGPRNLKQRLSSTDLDVPSMKLICSREVPQCTSFIEKIGIRNAECADVYGFDEELLAFLPQPHYALILCFPDVKANNLMAPVYEKLEKEGATIPEGVFFMNQKISNACGTFALFHSLANNADKIDLGDGSFRRWLDEAWQVGVFERSDLLANNEDLASAHESCAEEGETEVHMDDDIAHHFICYIHHNGRLLEVDSSRKFPRDCGPTTQETLLRDAGKVCQEVMNELGNVSFGAMALVGK
uniref:Ubiquitin carboxyl-terminal hydrolase n=1 Tax=Steinernema glaseri TaxID=37863 RepID=A0A1I7YVD0_9BILA